MKSISFRLAVLLGAVTLIAEFVPAQTATQSTSRPGPAQAAPAQPTPAKPTHAQTAPNKPILKGFPFTNESLSYVANWPSGLNLGEAHLSAIANSAGWRFELTLDAGVPGFIVKDTYQSTASLDLCSETFSKDFVHGTHKSKETVTIDKDTSTETRTPANGLGASKTIVPACIRDALTFLYYARRELGQGRVPTPQEIIFGATYNGSFEYAGAETVTVGDKRILTDKIVCHIKGPASDIKFDAYFDRDPARTPVSITVPLPLGKFSLELVR